MHSASLWRDNTDLAPDSTERPGLYKDEEKLSYVPEEVTRIEQIHSATEPHFKSDSTYQSSALSEDQDNASKRLDSLRKRRSVGHRDINKLNNLLSQQQEALDSLLNTYVSSCPWKIVSFLIPTTLITHLEWFHIVATIELPSIRDDHCIKEYYLCHNVTVPVSFTFSTEAKKLYIPEAMLKFFAFHYFLYFAIVTHTRIPALKWKWHHWTNFFVAGCTGSCQNDYFQCSQWWLFHPNDNIFVSTNISEVSFQTMDQ